MKQNFSFECKKVLKKKITWIACFCTIGAIVLWYFVNYSVAEDIRKGNIARYQNSVTSFQDFKNNAEIEKEQFRDSGDKESEDRMNMQVQHFQESVEKYERLKNSYSNGNWQDIYEYHIEFLQPHLDQYNASFSIEEQPISWFTLRATLAEMQEIKNRKVEPFIQNTIDIPFLPTAYDTFTGKAKEDWESGTKRFGTSGLYFLYQIIQSYYIPILILLGCFIFGNNISSERGGKNRSLHFYFVQPVSSNHLFFSKYFSGLLFTTGFVFIMLLIPFLCGLFTTGMGSPDYPVLIYEGSTPSPFGKEYNVLNPQQDSFHFINLGKYLGLTLLLTLALVIFLYSIYYLLSLRINNSGVTIILLTIAIFLGLQFPSAYNPFTYVDVHKALTGEFATIHFNSGITLQNGMLSLIILTIILIFLSYTLFNRRRI